MPASEKFLRDLKLMHVVFALSAFGLLGATVWMMAEDHAVEWHKYQREFYDIEANLLKKKEQSIKTASYEKQTQDLQARIEEAEKSLAGRQDDLRRLENEIAELQGDFARADREVKFTRAERDVHRANYDLAIRDGRSPEVLGNLKKIFDNSEAKVRELEIQLQDVTAALDAKKAEHQQLTALRDEADAQLRKLTTEVELVHTALAKIEPDDPIAAFKRWTMELPIIDGFNSHLKIRQDWIPGLTINYGGMREVARFDRCRTCHLGIDRVEAGNVPTFPADEYHQPYSTHPNPDLYLTASSPHPINKFGCTVCHEGQGSGTSFSNASHTPDNPAQQLVWEKNYHFHANHYWEYPMHPSRFAESSCIKCHHNVVELGVHPEFGASAPKVYEGYNLIRKYGCFGCHEINGYDGSRPIGPDLRLEPQTPEEAERIAADPNAVPGTLRKVGPSLAHIAEKTTAQWTEYWTEIPQRFRPTTRMPSFFKQYNAAGELELLDGHQDAHAAELAPVEIAALTHYLFDKSTPIELLTPPEGYEPNAERGKLLFSQRGCMACHSHEDFPDSKADFGPELSRVHAKIKPGQEGWNWVYTWIRDPERHHPRTKMPNLYLEPYTEGGQTIDPAADIAQYLLQKGPEEFDSLKVNREALNELALLYLSKVLPVKKAEAVLKEGWYPELNRENIKGDEIELYTGAPSANGRRIDDEMLLNYVGRRTISRYGCYGCHDIPGFDKARPIGTALQDWGRKDPSKLALEHIAEFLHHHGEPDGRSTAARATDAVKREVNDSFSDPETRDEELSVAFYYENLLHHGRPGFLWQKLRAPRSYDYEKTETKNFDERLRMPKFPFNQKEIEAIATFVLGLTAEPPAENYLYQPTGPARDRIEGEKLLAKYNCTGCHMVDLPEVQFGTDLAEYHINVQDEAARGELVESLKNSGMIPFARGVTPAELLGTSLADLSQLVRKLENGKSSERTHAVNPEQLLAFHEQLRQQIPSEVQRQADARIRRELSSTSNTQARQQGAERIRKETADTVNAEFERNWTAILAALGYGDWSAGDYFEALDLLAKLKPPRPAETGKTLTTSDARKLPVLSFRGLIYEPPDPESDLEDQEYSFDLWETLQIANRVLYPGSRMLVPATALASIKPGRGGEFAEWLVNSTMEQNREVNRYLAWQMAPPPLYLEGIKAQTPWLYNFLLNPNKLRHTTLLRMPQFNMSEEEAQILANYFSAVDSAEYPYQKVPQRDPPYLARMEQEHQSYLTESWKVLNAPLCIKCHSLSGREYQATDPKTDIRGPNLEMVPDRLRPDWTLLWLYKPQWITPYTSMPQPFPKNQSQFEDLFHGEGLSQTIAIRDALMNYHRMMETEGRFVTQGPAAPAEGNAPASEKPATNESNEKKTEKPTNENPAEETSAEAPAKPGAPTR